jgi:hypothetical protein
MKRVLITMQSINTRTYVIWLKNAKQKDYYRGSRIDGEGKYLILSYRRKEQRFYSTVMAKFGVNWWHSVNTIVKIGFHDRRYIPNQMINNDASTAEHVFYFFLYSFHRAFSLTIQLTNKCTNINYFIVLLISLYSPTYISVRTPSSGG